MEKVNDFVWLKDKFHKHAWNQNKLQDLSWKELEEDQRIDAQDIGAKDRSVCG